MTQNIFRASFTLTAAEANARSEMPTSLIAQRLIEVATLHANRLGIGYSVLSPLGIGWVLVRMAFDMERIPRINTAYSVITWIEDWNRLYSERCFRFEDADGNPMGYARTMWMTIDLKERKRADMSHLVDTAMMRPDEHCPTPRLRNIPRIKDAEGNMSRPLTFHFTDIDFNRHVNSVKYINHIMDMWPLRFYDRNRIKGLEICYHRECTPDQTVMIVRSDSDDKTESRVEIIGRDSQPAVSAALHFVPDPLADI